MPIEHPLKVARHGGLVAVPCKGQVFRFFRNDSQVPGLQQVQDGQQAGVVAEPQPDGGMAGGQVCPGIGRHLAEDGFELVAVQHAPLEEPVVDGLVEGEQFLFREQVIYDRSVARAGEP